MNVIEKWINNHLYLFGSVHFIVQNTISKDETTIGFFKKGTGPALLLVHGTTAYHSRWAPIFPRFEKHFTVYTMDRRGRGESGDSPRYDIMREAEDVVSVMEAIDEPVFLLHSYGDICGLEASLLTDKVRRLVLYEPPLPTGLAQYPPGLPDPDTSFGLIVANRKLALKCFFVR